MDTTEDTGSNENEDENTPGSAMFSGDARKESPVMESPLSTEQGSAKSSPSQTEQSIGSELEDQDEMENYNTDDGATEMSTCSAARDPTADVTAAGDNTVNNSTSLEISSNDEESEENSGPSTDASIDQAGLIPVESLDNEIKVELKPFDFLSYPDKVRQQILRAVLLSDKPIIPYWNLFALEVAEKDANVENYTEMLAAFAGNKELIDQATSILYGENSFHLRSARVSLWWLKRIGSNISKIRRLAITVEEGVMDGLGTRLEKIWASIFFLLQEKHRLLLLMVSFANWTNEVSSEDNLDPIADDHIWEPRYNVVRSLLSFRGLEQVHILPGVYVTSDCTGIIEGALILGSGETNDDVLEMESVLAPPKRSKYSFANTEKPKKTKVHKKTVAEDSVMTEDPSTTEKPIAMGEPIGSEVPTTTEEPNKMGESITTDEPMTTEDPHKTEEPNKTEESITTDEPMTTEDPYKMEGPKKTEAKESDKTEEPVSTKEPDKTKEPPMEEPT